MKSITLACAVFVAFVATQASATPQEVFLGNESDACNSVLRVKDRHNRWITIPREDSEGLQTSRRVDVAIDGDGYWYWKCGASVERSRGASAYRNRVKRLNVIHANYNRRILWVCYDLLN